MSDLLVRDLDPALVERLKLRAKTSGRSVQAEVKEILKSNLPLPMDEARRRIDEIRAQFLGRRFSDSADLIREDRER